MTERVVCPADTRTEMTWIVMPNHLNALGTVFGGQVMSWIDVCAAVSAQRFTRTTVVTASMDSLNFRGPIRKGDVAVLQAQVNWAGRTSMEVGVRVEREDRATGHRTHTATAYLTFVSVDDDFKPTSVPKLRAQTDEEGRRMEDAILRRADRLAVRERDRLRREARS